MSRSTRSITTRRIFSTVAFLLSILFLMSACSSTPEPIPEDLKPIEYFQAAQKLAMEEGDYQNALRFYRTFIERHPDDIQHVVEAQYEIAFLHYKQGNYAAAQEEFEKLLSYYEGGGQSVLPEWPQILGKKMLAKIESRQADAEEDADQPSEEDSSSGE